MADTSLRLQRGMLFALEGIDYCGKDTQFHFVHEWLAELVWPVPSWSEPNESGLIGKRIRQMLQQKVSMEADPFEFQRMYVIDRAQDVFCLVRPHLARKRVVLLNRYALSTIAYGMLTRWPAEDFIRLHEQVIGHSMVWPESSIVIDVSAETALARFAAKREAAGLAVEPQHFEKLETLRRMRENYLELARLDRRRDIHIGDIAVVNGERPVAEVLADIKAVIEPRLRAAAKEG